MPDGDSNLAQAIYLAQLFAARNTCKCKACQLLRKASDDMTDQMLGASPLKGEGKKKGKVSIPGVDISPQDLINVGEEQ